MRNFLLLITLLFVIACSEKGADLKSKVYTNSFTQVGQVTFEIDSLSDFNFTEFQVVKEDEQELLLVMNRVNFSFDYYDVESGGLAKRIAIQKDEKYPIPALYGFWYYNADSIFLFRQMFLNGITLLDREGTIVTQYNPQKFDRRNIDEIRKSVVNHYSRANNPTIYKSGKFYFSDMSSNGFLSSSDVMEEFRPAIVVDIDKDEVSKLDEIRVPDFYKGKVWPMDLGDYSRIILGDKIIYSWAALDSLLIFDQQSKVLKRVSALSEYAHDLKFTNIPRTFASGEVYDKETLIKERVSQTSYSYIFYDSYREVYYRFVNIRRDMVDADLEDQFPHLKNDFSIIVLDKDFNFLTEKRFPGKIHYPYKSFFGEKGLYLSRTNPFYEGLNEDEVVYDVYEFR